MSRLADCLARIPREEEQVRLVPYQLGDKLVTHFSPEDWALIMPGITSEVAWQEHIQEYSDVCACFYVEVKQTGERIGFFCLYQSGSHPLTVTHHGGGWHTDALNRGYYFRTTTYVLASLLRIGVRVHSSCALHNRPALRYLKALGFRPYSYTATHVHLTLSLKRLQASAVYHRYAPREQAKITTIV